MHRHRIGTQVFARMSELIYLGGRPTVVLDRVTFGDLPIPLYTAPLDPAKLRRMQGHKSAYHYDDTTVDPRYVDFAPEPVRRKPGQEDA